MNNIIFDMEELALIAVFTPDSRESAVERLEEALSGLDREQEDEMTNLIKSSIEKLMKISDRAFEELDLDAYRTEPEEMG